MTSLTERLVANDIEQDMECKEGSVHNGLAVAQKTFVLVASKVKDSILYVMMAPFIVVLLVLLANPVANLECAKVPNYHVF